MPHIVLEHSDNLPELPDFSALFNDIHQALNRIGGIKLDNCKSRTRVAEHCYIGAGDPDNACIRKKPAAKKNIVTTSPSKATNSNITRPKT